MHYEEVKAFVHTLVLQGVRHLVYAPGSRSTPIALIGADHPDLKLWRHNDERSAGFFALGMAKALQSPVALLCTSGTAAANFLPAIIESQLSRVPLIILTADRPPEARSNASPQEIDQIKMYGSYVKWFMEMDVPGTRRDAGRINSWVQRAAAAVAIASDIPKGPVHVNFPFREPLIPENPGLTSIKPDSPSWGVHVTHGASGIDDTASRDLVTLLALSKRGLIFCGPQVDAALPPLLAEMAEIFKFPILADPLSMCRTGRHDLSFIVDGHDVLLRDKSLRTSLNPDLIVRIGGVPASKSVQQFLANFDGDQVLIDSGDWRDPYASATHVYRADPALVLGAIVSRVDGVRHEDHAAQIELHQNERLSFANTWLSASRDVGRVLKEEADDLAEFFEGRIFTELHRLLPDDATLFVGNSMPIRDLDTFFRAKNSDVHMMANRGANGIDGVLSSALGVKAVRDGPLCLVIGDLSFHHDIGALATSTLHRLDMTVILLNNDGGGIFSFLPQAEKADHFEELFGTPHGIDFAPIVQGFGGRFSSPQSWDEFASCIVSSFDRPGLDVIEIKTDRTLNVKQHRQVIDAAIEAVKATHNDRMTQTVRVTDSVHVRKVRDWS